MNTIQSINPANGNQIDMYALHTDQDIRDGILNTHEAYVNWKSTSYEERSILFNHLADLLEERKHQLAQLMTLEMGKTIQSAKSEVEKCAWMCNYYADHARNFLKEEIIKSEASFSKVVYRPLGVVLAIMPWNFPFWQVFRFAAPTLMAGNAALLKHASNVPGCALEIEKLFIDAGFPKHLFKTLLITSQKVEEIIKSPLVKAITLTGSGPAGAAVASVAGSQIKKSVLELGGSDPYIILEDADIEHAVHQCVQSRILNAGQSCIGAKRFIAVDAIYEEFKQQFVQRMESITYGDPFSDVDMGPLARHNLRNEVHQQVVESVNYGAILNTGGYIPEGEGAFYPPTVLTNVKKGMPAYEEEIFGPVASVIHAKNEKEAIRIANDTNFGLGACIFTQDLEKGEAIATNQLEAGCCFVNQFVKSDPRLPFGGIKQSGFGRELGSWGIKEFVNTKTVYIK